MLEQAIAALESSSDWPRRPASHEPHDAALRCVHRRVPSPWVMLSLADAVGVAACGTARGERDERNRPRRAGASRSRRRAPVAGDGDAPRDRRPRRQPDGRPRACRRRRRIPRSCSSASTRAGFDYEVVNAGVSGDTSAGGLSPARLGARRRRAGADRGARRQRRAARPAGRRAADATCRRSSSARRRADRAWSSPAWKRRRTSAATTSSPSTRCIPRWRSNTMSPLVPFLLEGVAGIERAEPARRHSSDRRGRADRRRQRLDGARADAARPTRARTRKAPPIDDRAPRRFEDGHERHRAAHHPSSADDHDSARAVRGHRRPVGQRQVDAARTDRRPRRADLRLGARSTASTSRGSTKTRWPSCAARRSASSSSSSI